VAGRVVVRAATVALALVMVLLAAGQEAVVAVAVELPPQT